MRLAEMTWKQAEKVLNEETLVVVLTGSVEQHGAIAPLGTDVMVPEEILKRMEGKLEFVSLPMMPFGVCPYHQDFPGTINIGYEAFYEVMENVVKSLMRHGARRFLFLNGHGGNGPALEKVALNAFRRGGLAAQIDWWSLAAELNPAWAGGHGDGQESSVMMAIRPDLVKLENWFEPEINHLTPEMPNNYLVTVKYKGGTVKVIRAVNAVSSNGGYGTSDTTKSNKEMGEDILNNVTDYIVDFCQEFKKAPLPKDV